MNPNKMFKFKYKNKIIQNLPMRIQWQNQILEKNKKHLILDYLLMIWILKKGN